MKIFDDLNIRHWLAIAAFIAGIGFAIAGMCIYPYGEIHSSVLIMIGLLFILSGTFLGLRIDLDKSQGKLQVGQEEPENK